MDTPFSTSEAASKPALLMVLLLLPAALAAVIGTAGAFGHLASALQAGTPALEAGLGAATYLTVGWSAAGLLCALAWLVRRQHDAATQQRKMLAAMHAALRDRNVEVPVAEPVAQDTQDPHLELLAQVLAEMEELNANLLLSEKQLTAKRRSRQERTSRRLAAQITDALESRQFARAEQLLEELFCAVPDDPQYGKLTARLTEARARAEADDIEAATQRAEDLMAVGVFDQAEKVARELLSTHPDAEGAKALLDHIRHEGEKFAVERRQSLYAEVERHVDARQWRKAVEAGRRLLEECDPSPETETVAARMPTLEENARLEEARELRDEIRDLLQRKRYVQALATARQVIQRFPETQVAAELSGQIDVLRRRAEGREG